MNTNADRLAYNVDQAQRAYIAETRAWLANNPHIGVLNGGQYYKVINGAIIYVNRLAN